MVEAALGDLEQLAQSLRDGSRPEDTLPASGDPGDPLSAALVVAATR